jgi:TfoX/Sxy family transcriptional regulator of competence genes
MSTDTSFIDYLRDQLSAAGDLTFKKMFGEYAVYLEGKVVALVCDNQLFIKPTQTGRALLENMDDVSEAPPYSGAKPSFLIGEALENRQAIAQILQATAAELPLPKPKKKAAKSTAKI